MKTKNSRAFSLVLIASLLIAAVCHATPPRPPAELEFGSREVLATSKVREGAFRLPVRVRVNEDVSNLQIQVRVLTEDPLRPKEVDKGSYPIEGKARGKQEASVEVKVVAKRDPGRYRVEVELIGTVGERSGVLDREVIYLIVERDRQQLMWPEDLRRLDQQSRWKAFQDHLRKNPDRPDLRLLNPGTIRVPEDLASKAVVDMDRPQLGVRATGPDATLKRFVVDHASKNWREIIPSPCAADWSIWISKAHGGRW